MIQCVFVQDEALLEEVMIEQVLKAVKALVNILIQLCVVGLIIYFKYCVEIVHSD